MNILKFGRNRAFGILKTFILFFLLTIPLIAAPSTTHAQGETILGVTTGNNLIRFHSDDPATIVDTIAITGLQPSESIVGMDFRPANNTLYAVGDTSRLYTINLSTGAATQVGAVFSPVLNGNAFGVDFNPVADRLRVVSNTEQNLRINPADGAVLSDSALAYDASDINNAADPNVVAAAYTNNSSTAGSTSLFGIDTTLDVLVRQGGVNSNPSPNLGALFTIGATGVDSGENAGFDIAPSRNGRAFLSLTGNDNLSKLYSVDLAGGAATLIGNIGTATNVRDIAILPGGTFDFSAPNYVVSEADGNATVTIIRRGNTSGASSVTVTTSNGSASSSSDYTTTTTTLNFADGEISKSFNVPIINDANTETNETIVLALSDPTNGSEIEGTGSALITIADNDGGSVAGSPVLLVSASTRVAPGDIFSGKGLRTEASCSEACTIKATFTLAAAFARKTGIGDPKIGEVTAALSQAGKTNLNFTFSTEIKNALRGRSDGNTATLSVVATDSDNNSVTQTIRIAVKR